LKILTIVLRLIGFVIFVLAVGIVAYVALHIILGVLKMAIP